MKLIPTKILRQASLAGVALAASAAALAANVEPIVAPTKRTETLERARQLLANKEAGGKQPNPFYSGSFEEVRLGGPARSPGEENSGEVTTPASPSGPRTSRDMLQAIAASLKPGGFIVMGGAPSLSFGQKRVKPGGLLTITFEGKEYTLEITAINRTNFTLRLDREEFTRPIK